MTGSDISHTKDELVSSGQDNYRPELENVVQADEKDLFSYKKDLRQFFLKGKKTSQSMESSVFPVLLAPLVREESQDLDFEALSAFQILNEQLKKRSTRNEQFLKVLKTRVAGLNELLHLQEDESDHIEGHFDFAGDLISFDKVADISLPEASTNIPEGRINRLKSCLKTLTLALKSYSGKYCTIFTSKKLAGDFDLNKSLSEATINLTSGDPSMEAKDYYSGEINNFIRTIGALRLAELEIKQEYNEELHTSYFENFSFSYLSDDDIRFFRSIIIIEDSKNLTHHPGAILSLLSRRAPVKVFALNRYELLGADLEDNLDDTHLELAALAILRRNTYVYQGTAQDPESLENAFAKGLDSPNPALWNILSPSPGTKHDNKVLLALRIAMESRYFPKIEYDINTGDSFGSHFDISGNPQPDRSFPYFDQDVNTSSGPKAEQFTLTVADFITLIADNVEKLEILPPQYNHENLVSLENYLTDSHDSLVGKTPFIWMVNDSNKLRQAVIPVSWLQAVRSRLDYWGFIQELGGENSYHVNHALKEAKTKWEASKKAEIEELKAQLLSEYDQNRTKDIENAIKRLLNSLLDPEAVVSAPVPIGTMLDNIVDESSVEEEKEVEEQAIVPVKSEAWIESDECTSCNDCIDLLPSVFKYNSDKLAFVHNPTGGPYAKIVSAAEKCPARCIHPGLPHDTNEKNLEKLIKRAEKYN